MSPRAPRLPIAAALLATVLAGGATAPAHAEVTGVNLPSTLAANPWADGTWHVRAIHVDAGNQPVGALSTEATIVLTSQAPNADPVVPADLPDGDQIWFYRKLGAPISVGDSLEVFKFTCPEPKPSICQAANGGTVFLSNALFTGPETVLPVALQSFGVE
jgi:hypothetical protein